MIKDGVIPYQLTILECYTRNVLEDIMNVINFIHSDVNFESLVSITKNVLQKCDGYHDIRTPW